MFPHPDGKRADSYIAKLARIATVRVKSCGVVVRALSGAALTSATTPAPIRNLSPSWVVSLSVATSFHTTSVGGTVSRLYMCKSVVQTMTSQASGLPLCQGIRVQPSGHFPSL